MDSSLFVVGKSYWVPPHVAGFFIEEVNVFDSLKVSKKFVVKIVLTSGVALPIYESTEEGNCLNVIEKFKIPKKGVF